MPTKESILIESDALFKITIDNYWTANNFTDLFDSINRLYGYTLHLLRSIDSFERMAKEYNWGDKYNKLPEYLNLTADFKTTAIEILQSPNLNDYTSGKYWFTIAPPFPLSVKRIKYGSRGAIDLLGIGKIFEIIKDLFTNYIPNESQKLDNIIKEKEIEEREQKILQMKIDNLKKLGLNSSEILTLIGFESYHLKNIRELINNKKIIDFQIEKHTENK